MIVHIPPEYFVTEVAVCNNLYFEHSCLTEPDMIFAKSDETMVVNKGKERKIRMFTLLLDTKGSKLAENKI